MRFWTLALSVILALGAMDAQAKRLGGGRTIGKTSSAYAAQRPTPPAQPNAAATKPAPAPAAPAPAPARPWRGMLAGLAAGLGLAWLASSLGLGAAFGQILLLGLLALAVALLFGWFSRRRRPASAPGSYAFQGAGLQDVATAYPGYRPENVGNDASARPWERPLFDSPGARTASDLRIGSALTAEGHGIPADFDVSAFLKAAKGSFILLQAAWDKADVATLRSMMTDEMLDEIKSQLAERERENGGAQNLTEVQMLQAQLLDIEDLGDGYLASVEFSGMIREEPQAGPNPFREVWNMTKPRDGGHGWLVAGVQALQ